MDLKNLIDPNTRYVFLTNDAETFAGNIVRVDDERLYFSCHKTLPASVELGYFLAQNGAGIVQFKQPRLERLHQSEESQNNLHLYQMSIAGLDFSIINRRRSFRYEFKEFLPVSFNVFGEFMAARLMNISEGGLRMCIDTAINKDVLCHLQIKIPAEEGEIRLNTDGVTVYVDSNEASKQVMVGISFVTPDFASQSERVLYLTAQQKLREFVKKKESAVR